MCDCQDDLSGYDLQEAASGEGRTAEDVFASTASPIKVLFWDGARGQKVVSQTITDDHVSVAVANSGNLWIQTIQSKAVTLFCSGSSTLTIKNLSCDQLTIYVGYASTVNLENVNVTTDCAIDVHYSSYLRLNAGFIQSISGVITNGSTGCHRGGLTIKSDTVKESSGSTWTSFCL